MKAVRSLLRFCFDQIEGFLGRIFPAAWNPLLNLGALGFFFYWIITVSGIYIYIFFDTGIEDAFASVEYMTHEQWYLAGIMRSLHRYASDALIVVLLTHLLREFAQDRYRGVRWFSWVTGIFAMIIVYVSGITGYWLVWDKLAQYVAIVSTEWLDLLPIFGEPIARNFLSPESLDSRFFTLMMFMHIAVPLIGLAVLWIHLQRITKPRINPPRGLAVTAFASLMALSLVYPALSQPPADLAVVPGNVGLDWFYLPLFPLFETLPGSLTWSASAVIFLILVAIPWLPPLKSPRVAVIDLDNCNGCARCFHDCPYGAITLVARSDGKAFEREPIVDPAYCVSCGLCAGACPTSMPYRRLSELSPGIDLPDSTIADLREQTILVTGQLRGKNKIIVYGCHSCPSLSKLASDRIGFISLPCIGQLPPAFIDYILSRDLADGVMLTGCRENSCTARFGTEWTRQRLARERDPYLRGRVPRERVKTAWVGPAGSRSLQAALDEFTVELESANSEDQSSPEKETRTARGVINA
ncbi:MAG: cytochrome b N-terminal domain-containing protein [Methyloligellaceae bacterium]